MKLKLPIIFLLFVNSFLLSQNINIKESLEYDTSGYQQGTASKENLFGDNALTPTINAEMSVNESGALTYMLPIEVMKGLNNFQPNIALAYNSQSGNGQAGWGWNIVGLSSVTRGGKSKDIDGLTIGAQFNDSDPFYLDGQRLIKINESTFVTEKFSRVKVTRLFSGEFQFIVKYTDGKIAKYKELTTGQYYISTMIDAMDNEIHYSYDVVNDVPNLKQISYGGASAQNDKFFVNFYYTNRKYPISIYRDGKKITNHKLLNQITTSSTYASGTYRNYIFEVNFIENNTVERLASITIQNENGEYLKPLYFNYNTSNAADFIIYQSTGTGLSNASVYDNGLGSVTVGSFSGNGKIGALYQVRRSDGSYVIRNSNLGGGLPNSNNNSKSLFFSGKTLVGNSFKATDDFIAVNTIYPSSTQGEPDPAGIYMDEISFKITDPITLQEKTVKYTIQGGVGTQTTYNSPDPYVQDDRDVTTTYFRDDSERYYIPGDFNNDGLLDFIVGEKNIDYSTTRPNRVYFLEVGKDANRTDVIIPKLLHDNLTFMTYDTYPLEFDGDGIPELMVVNQYFGNYNIYKINFPSNNSDNPTLSILSSGKLSNFGTDTPIFFGDFNGDGLTDFITPQKVYSIEYGEDDNGTKLGNTYLQIEQDTLLWWMYTSTGKGFLQEEQNFTNQKIFYIKPSQNNSIKRSTFWQKFWNGKPDEYAYTRYSTHNIIITDYDGDGRSDIITLNKIGKAKYAANGKLANTTIDNLSNTLNFFLTNPPRPGAFNSSITNQVNLFLNKSVSGGGFVKHKSKSITDIRISPLSLILSNTDFNRLNVFSSGFFIHDPITVTNTSIIIDNSNFLEKQIQSVDNGSTVLQKVEYRNMKVAEDFKESTYLYTPSAVFPYPYYVHNANPGLYLVNKIHTIFSQNINNNTSERILTKEYRYENGVQHLEGKGFLGFQKTYVSDAYESEFKDNRYRVKNPFKGIFWNIQTKDPLMENSVISSSYGGIKKYFTENTVTNQRFDMGNHQYLILPTKEVSVDNLKKITITKNYQYDQNDDLKLKSAYTDYGNAGANLTTYAYKQEFTKGDHYFYGKIEEVVTTNYRDALSFKTKDESSYDANGNLFESKKYGNDFAEAPVVTSYTYDSIGNIASQTLSTDGISSQTTSFTYDQTGRYVNKTTTPDGLSSSSIVNYLGRVSEDTSSLGLKTYYTYDSWGNITAIKDYLGITTYINKSVDNSLPNAVYNLSKKREGGTESIVTFDQFDREIQSKTQSLNGSWVVAQTQYDVFGKKIKYSEPFFEGTSPKWNEITYDELNRPLVNKMFTGKEIKTCYEGMKVTVDDGYKKTSKTLDAMGYTVRHEDHGGVITYSYFPNGAVRETNYDGIKTTMEIDAWGNKSKIVDPSAGTFTYNYDRLGRVTKESHDKGDTSYTYDNLGRPLTEMVVGRSTTDNTNITKTYYYNAASKLPVRISGTSNGKSFTYTTSYDQYYRISGKSEITSDFTYTSTTTFDSYGRADVVTMTTKLNNPSYTTSSSVKNIYDTNGILYFQKDNETGAGIWHISSITPQGQTKQMEYGNGYIITTDYRDSDTSITDIRHLRTSTGEHVVDIGYNYNLDKGVLMSRNNRAFGKEEKYTYDELNRLLSEKLNDAIVNEYTYDKRGRLTSNTDLGKYNYPSNNYKLNNIEFNASGQQINNQRGFADIKYNAFKSPLSIKLSNKEDLSFDYNILNSRYKMTSAITGEVKLYSSDFAVEITKNGNKTEIVTFITGDPYSANFMKKEVLVGGTVTSKDNYYLHRDNQGTILAITKSDGSVVEKRYFDAWGNIKMLVNAAGQTITDHQQLMTYDYFIDRGYTGHEHLWRAGLINMNARIYDPILRRFLSPDNYVQDPFNTQSYNRYGYVFNNPLMYTDPSGNLGFLAIVAIGIAVAVVSNGIANMIQGIPFWHGMGKAGTMGALSAAISFGIGSLATDLFSTVVTVGKAAFQAGMHALSGGMMSAIDGGDFGAGALSGLLSSAISSVIEGLGQTGVEKTGFKMKGGELKSYQYAATNSFGDSSYFKAVMIASGGLSGGIGSTIAGGNFWKGFKQGVMTSGLNHVAHIAASSIESKSNQNKLEKKLSENGINDSCSTKEAFDLLKIVFNEQWSLGSGWGKFADEPGAISEWEKNDSQKITITPFNNIKAGTGKPALGITNGLGQMLYATSLYSKPVSSFAEVFLHELVHSIDFVGGFYKGFSRLGNINELMEYRAYKYVYDWTGKNDPNLNSFKRTLGPVPSFLINYTF